MSYYDTICIAELCDCEYSDDSNILGSICTHCKKREEIEQAKPWYIEVKTIRKYFNQMDKSTSVDERLPIIRNIFEYILTRPIFIAANPNFRKAMLNKMNELRQCQDAASLKDVFDKTDKFIESLSDYNEYKI
jgi:hypothetical protein